MTQPERHPLDRFTDPHVESDLCHGEHCHIHQVDEPVLGAYRVCGECGHVYYSRHELRQAYRREWLAALRAAPVPPPPPWSGVVLVLPDALTPKKPPPRWVTWVCNWWRVVFPPMAKNISFCQECVHDF